MNVRASSLVKSSRSLDKFLALSSRAVSAQARSLISRIYEISTDWEIAKGKRKNKRGPGTAPQFRETLERLVGDLLREQSQTNPGSLYRSMRAKEFNDAEVAYRNIAAAVKALVALGLIERIKGTARYRQAFGGSLELKGRASRFRATVKLVKLADKEGVSPSATFRSCAP